MNNNLSLTAWKPKKKTLLIVCVIIVAILAGLLTIAAFFDYQISEMIAAPLLPTVPNTTIDLANGAAINQLGQVYTNSIFGRIIEIIGTAPCIIVTVCALAIFYWNSNRIKNDHLRRFTKISMVTLSIAWNIYACFFQFFPLLVISVVGVQNYGGSGFGPLDGMGHINNPYTVALYISFGAIFGAIMTAPVFLMFKQVKTQTMRELLRWAFITSTACLASIVTIEVLLKPLLQRERFRFIYAFSQVNLIYNSADSSFIGMTGAQYSTMMYGGFHSWYELPLSPTAYQSGNLPFISEDVSKSFPSGHMTMAAAGFYSLVILPLTVRSLSTKKWRWILFTTAFVGAGLVGFGRVLCGAHFLSDVVMGSFIAMSFLTIFYCTNVYANKWLDKQCGFAIRERKIA